MKPDAPSDTSAARAPERSRATPRRDHDDFERALAAQDAAPAAPWAAPRFSLVEVDTASAALPVERPDAVAPGALRAARPEPVPAAVQAAADPAQAAWVQKLLTPSAAPSAAARFEVLDARAPAGMTAVEVQALSGGRVQVAAVAGAEHATLLDRHLPQLQRRLAGRAVPQVRVEAREDEPRR